MSKKIYTKKIRVFGAQHKCCITNCCKSAFMLIGAKVVLILILFLFIQIQFIFAQDSDKELLDELKKTRLKELKKMYLADLLNVKVELATKTEQSIEEAPSVVSVISQHDIEIYGARDIADILRLVPGFEFGIDVVSLVGLNFRGIWVHEGKALIMINNMPVNDYFYGNYNFIGSIPASMIERVEIIRGPGSALYGGFAEVAVINIITKKGVNLNGVSANGNIGIVGSGEIARNGNISFGTKSRKVEFSSHASYNLHPLSSRKYNDFFGNSLQLGIKNSFREWQHIIGEVSTKNFTFLYNRNTFTFLAQDGDGRIVPPLNNINTERLQNYIETAEIKYKGNILENLTLESIASVSNGNSISSSAIPAARREYETPGTSITRYCGEFLATYNIEDLWQFTAGTGYIREKLNVISSAGLPGVYDDSNPPDSVESRTSDSKFIYTQYLLQLSNLDIILGGRYEITSFGNIYAPRVGVTFVNKGFNSKLLFGQAFRIPSSWQTYSIQYYNNDLKPEITNTTEFEIGYKLTQKSKLKLNVFYIDILDPIVYFGDTDLYINSGRIQSMGNECELQVNYSNYGGFLNFAYSKPGSKTSDNITTVSKKQFLGSPPIKISGGGYYKIKSFEIGGSFIFLSSRSGQSIESANSNKLVESVSYNPVFLFNLNLIARGIIRGVDLNLSGHNIFNAKYNLIQPYYGSHSPMPANDRQITLGMSLQI